MTGRKIQVSILEVKNAMKLKNAIKKTLEPMKTQ